MNVIDPEVKNVLYGKGMGFWNTNISDTATDHVAESESSV